jgi:hypothetical protein
MVAKASTSGTNGVSGSHLTVFRSVMRIQSVSDVPERSCQ